MNNNIFLFILIIGGYCKSTFRRGHPAEILHGRDRRFTTHNKFNFVLNTWNHASIFRILDKQ